MVIETLSAAGELEHPKRKGEYVEARFLARMLELGYTVCKPWGDSARYDFIVERSANSQIANHASRMVRVQVKSCWRRVGNHYAFRTTGNTPRHPTYTARDLDFIAALVVPLNLWYIVPISAISPGQSFFCVFPHHSPRMSSRASRKRAAASGESRDLGAPIAAGAAKARILLRDYERFREAWGLMETEEILAADSRG